MKKILLFIFGVALFASCASSKASLQRATARSVGQNTLSGDYTISNVKRGALNVSWDAKSKDGKCYRCEADDMVRRVNCVKSKCK